MNVKAELSKIAGFPVDVTIRGPRNFTWSIEEVNKAAAERLREFAAKDPRAAVTVEHDDEVGSFVYVDVA